MGTFFGIGLFETIIIASVALLLMGPIEIATIIRTVSRRVGRLTAQMQALAREFSRQLSNELMAIEFPDNDPLSDIKELRRELQSLRQELNAIPRVTHVEQPPLPTSLLEEMTVRVEKDKKAITPSEDSSDQPDKETYPNLPKPINIEDNPPA